MDLRPEPQVRGYYCELYLVITNDKFAHDELKHAMKRWTNMDAPVSLSLKTN
jgi:hypothetical protein